MRKSGKGGNTPFFLTTKPNVLTPLTNEEMLGRRGESCLWYRLTPCPCPTEERLPDCKFCYDGLIRNFQETLEIKEEMAYKVENNRVYTRFSPIHRVHSINLISRESHKPLTIKRIYEEYIEVEEILKYWNAVLLHYEVSMIEEITVEAYGENEYSLYPKIPLGAIVGVVEVFKVNENGETSKQEYSGFTFNSIQFLNRVNGLFRLRLKFIYPVKVGYKTYRSEQDVRKIFGNSQITFNDGEVMAVMGAGYNLGQGDIIILLVSSLIHSEFIPYQFGSYDRVSYSPIKKVEKIFSKEKSSIKVHIKGQDYQVFGDSKIQWLTDKPKNGYSIIYEYHPSFRVTGFVESGSGEDRDKPKIFKMKPLSNLNTRE
ncbi:hypothetical protein [Leptospira interrogans]|uniref:hypothetical protein n=1 Tax=Leptospira interrogans TaxID=173 RepID=UPI00077475B5|nr:hypothetical protein [Leptospira interrogans]